MNDAVITELISAILAASKDGNGTLTLAAVRCHLAAASLIEPAAAEEDLEDLTRFRDALSKRV